MLTFYSSHLYSNIKDDHFNQKCDAYRNKRKKDLKEIYRVILDMIGCWNHFESRYFKT